MVVLGSFIRRGTAVTCRLYLTLHVLMRQCQHVLCGGASDVCVCACAARQREAVQLVAWGAETVVTAIVASP